MGCGLCKSLSSVTWVSSPGCNFSSSCPNSPLSGKLFTVVEEQSCMEESSNIVDRNRNFVAKRTFRPAQVQLAR